VKLRFLTFEEELAIDDEALNKMLELYPNLTKQEIRNIAIGTSHLLPPKSRELRQQFNGIWRDIYRRILGKE
jgi:hypothetical protein